MSVSRFPDRTLGWLALIILHIPLALVTVYFGQPTVVTVWLVTINILFSMFLMNLFDPRDLDPPNVGPGCLMIIAFVVLTAISIGIWSSVLAADALAQSGFIIVYMLVITFGAYRLERFSEIKLQKLAEEEKNAAEELASENAAKEQRRLRKTLVDELSNLRNSKTADDDKS